MVVQKLRPVVVTKAKQRPKGSIQGKAQVIQQAVHLLQTNMLPQTHRNKFLEAIINPSPK
jgi:hypothetical protein